MQLVSDRGQPQQAGASIRAVDPTIDQAPVSELLDENARGVAIDTEAGGEVILIHVRFVVEICEDSELQRRQVLPFQGLRNHGHADLGEAAGQRDRNTPDRRASAPGHNLNGTIRSGGKATGRHCLPL
jgi:hypothetical protein